MTGKLKKCPFKVGNIVVDRPSERGWALEVMASPEGKLIPGKESKSTWFPKFRTMLMSW
jgi:hypothetical protein